MKARPELFISTKNGNTPLNITPLDVERPAVSKIFAEIDKYSITPTTFKSRTLNKEDLTYIDKYSHKDNEVMRFGINASNIEVDLPNKQILGEQVVLYDPKALKEKASQSTAAIQKVAENILHHHLEKHLLQQAINFLLKTSNTTALVDIFARENGGIKIDSKNPDYPEIHTVVLYKNPAVNGKHEVLVIDPSNFSFSSHLSNIKLHQELKGNLQNDLFDKVTTIHKTLQIYKADNSDNVGPNPNQYRDCIDIAVKLAFGLNKLNEELQYLTNMDSSVISHFGFEKLHTKINLENVKDLDVVKSISNNQTINKSMPDDMYIKQFVKVPLRIQQKSNTKIEEDFYKFSKTIKENIINIVQKDQLQEAYIKEIINSDQNFNIDTLSQLHAICKGTFLQMHQELEAQETQVLGGGFNSTFYEGD